MTQNQHRVTEWYLRRFSHQTRANGPELDTYSKATGKFGTAYPARFLARMDDHSADVERRLAAIEGPAAAAADTLAQYAVSLRPGLYAIGDEDLTTSPEELTEVGLIEGMRILTTQRQIRLPPGVDLIALAKFLALMFTRSPMSERVSRLSAAAYHDGAVRGAAAFGFDLRGRALAEFDESVAEARWVGLRNANEWAEMLRRRMWWLVRARDDEGFIIGDSPVVSASALGHDGEWQPLIGGGFTVLAFPLSPRAALLVSGPAMPTMIESDGLVSWINRTTWRWATEYVAAESRDLLKVVSGEVPTGPQATVSFPEVTDQAREAGLASAFRTMTQLWIESDAPRFLDRWVRGPSCPANPRRGFPTPSNRLRHE